MTDSNVIEGEVIDTPAQHLQHVDHSHAQVGANPYLSMIETMVSRGGDLANLDKMLDLQLRWEANEARKAYVGAMAAFKAEPMEILKRKQVSFKTSSGKTEYMHAELSDVTDGVVPAMGKHGLSHAWGVKQEGPSITVSCTITHALGHSETVAITASPDSSGGKNAIQSVASTISYLQRYTLLSATGMATKGMDDDGRHSDAPMDAEPAVDLTSWFDAVGALVDKTGLQKLKAEMVTKFGGALKIPKDLVRAYNARLAEVEPK